MSRRRRGQESSWLNRALLVCLAVLLGIGLVTAFAGAIAEALVGPRHPAIQTFVAWLILALFAAACAVLLLAWSQRRRSRFSRLPELLALTPRQFEEAVGKILNDLGFNAVRHIGASGDLCADLLAVDRQGRSVVVQCKRFAPGSKVGSPEIQKFIGMMVAHHRTDRGIFVTTSVFTGPAIELAKRHSIDLWDGNYLSRQLEQIHASAARMSA